MDTSSDKTSGTSIDDAEYSTEGYKVRLDEYKSALSQANENIESANQCARDSFDLFDSGDFDEGMSVLDSCETETVNEP